MFVEMLVIFALEHPQSCGFHVFHYYNNLLIILFIMPMEIFYYTQSISSKTDKEI